MAIVSAANDNITVTDPTPAMIAWANKLLTYTDKSKQYQLRRMAKNPWQRNSQLFKDLQSEVQGQLFEHSGNTLNLS